METIQSDLLYTEDHEWILVEDSIATVGITDHAQGELGDITFVELPEDDTDIHVGDEAANIESVKATTPVFAPVTGAVVEVNADLEENPENVNHDPYGAGWIFKLELSDAAELEKLMNAEQYEEFLSKAGAEAEE